MDYNEYLRYARIMDSMPNVGIENLTNEQRVMFADYLKTLWETAYNDGYSAAVERGDFLRRNAFRLASWLKSRVIGRKTEKE